MSPCKDLKTQVWERQEYIVENRGCAVLRESFESIFLRVVKFIWNGKVWRLRTTALAATIPSIKLQRSVPLTPGGEKSHFSLEFKAPSSDLSGFVLSAQAALRFFRPVALQVRADDGVQRHGPPHAEAQLLRFGLSSCRRDTSRRQWTSIGYAASRRSATLKCWRLWFRIHFRFFGATAS